MNLGLAFVSVLLGLVAVIPATPGSPWPIGGDLIYMGAALLMAFWSGK